MIIVHGLIPIRPDVRDRALDLARRMSEATQAEEGCITYDFSVGLADPNSLLLFQEWESMDALVAHFQTPHMEDFLRELPEIVAGEITTRRYAVQSIDDDGDEDTVEFEQAPPIIH